MRCVWCDSEYTFTGGDHLSIADVLEQVERFNCKLVEVTGGEPLAQKEALALIKELCERQYEVLIETGGYVPVDGVDPRAKIILDIKCPASGEADRNHWPNLERLRSEKDEVKFVIADRADWDYAQAIIKEYDLENKTRAVLVSPVWNQIDLKELSDWISGSGMNVRLQLQLHKYIWGADARGV
jgi:7-carboxy-7-deazaguanine synthase